MQSYIGFVFKFAQVPDVYSVLGDLKVLGSCAKISQTRSNVSILKYYTGVGTHVELIQVFLFFFYTENLEVVMMSQKQNTNISSKDLYMMAI